MPTGNSTLIKTSAVYTPPGPSFQSSHTQFNNLIQVLISKNWF
jgi:hypothetical protein